MRYIAWDFETHLISAEAPRPRPVCLSWYDGKNEGLEIGMENMEKFLFKTLRSDQHIIAHNMSFEAGVIDEHFPDLRKLLVHATRCQKFACTKVIEQLIDNTRKNPIHQFSLAKVVNNYFGVDLSAEKNDPDAWRLRYSELEGVKREDWPEKAVRYAIDDSIWAYKAYKEQMKTPTGSHKGNSQRVEYDSSVLADIYLNKMGLYGITINPERVALLEKEINAKLAPAYMKLIYYDLVTMHPVTKKFKKNMKFLREFLQTHVTNLEKTPKGNTSTSAESMQNYLMDLDPATVAYKAIVEFLNVIKYEKVLTSFVVRLKQADPLIRTQYKAVVSSGRTSSSTSSLFPSLNVQQLPREVPDVTWDIRNCCVPRPGHKICSIDYAGLELASTAQQLYLLTGRRDMLDTINSGDKPVDMHSMLAYKIMNLKEKGMQTYDTFMEHKKEPMFKKYRQLAKPINLGFPGGIGYDTMRTLLCKEGINPKVVVLDTVKYERSLSWKLKQLRSKGYPVRIRRTGFREFQLIYDELVELKQELFSLYPDLEYFLSEKHKDFLTGETKWIKDEFGEWKEEPMYSFEVGDFKRDWCMYTQLCNGILMQSPSAIGAKRALVDSMLAYGDSPAVRPLAFIHDEILFEVLDTADVEAIIKDMSYIMIDAMQKVLPDVRITVEAELMNYWSKSENIYSVEYFKNPM